MARLARVVAPGFAHYITQRGNRRQQTFFCDEDYQSYLELMGEWCGAHNVEILAGAGRSARQACPELAWFPRPGGPRGGHQAAARTRAYRPTTGRGGVLGDARTRPGQDSETAEARPQTQAPEPPNPRAETSELTTVSAEPFLHQIWARPYL